MTFPSILICVALAAVVGLIVFRMIQNKRAGRSSCGCGCGGCAMQGLCHTKGEQEQK